MVTLAVPEPADAVTEPEVIDADAVAEGLLDSLIDERRAQRNVAGRNSLRETHDIRLDAPAAATEQAASSTEAGDHFISNQKNAIFIADIAHERPIIFRRYDDAACALYGFGDESGDSFRALELNLPLKFIRA